MSNNIVKLTRWRARDYLAACFYACKITRIVDDDDDDHEEPRKKPLEFDPIGKDRRRRRKITKRNGKSNLQEKAESSSMEKKKKSDEKEEEYIVFCFKDDGTIRMLKEKRRSAAMSVEKAWSSSFVDVEDLDDDEETMAGKRAQPEKTSKKSRAEGEGSENVAAAVSPPDEIEEIINSFESHEEAEAEPKTLSSMLSVPESSSDSDASSGSFAFPILRWEWMGSPVHMPRPEDINIGLGLGTQKARGACNCCRF